MKIRTKLAWTFILLLLFAINGVSSYSIVFIRDFLLKKGVQEIQRDARWMALTVENLGHDSDIQPTMAKLRKVTDYQLILYDESGRTVRNLLSDSLRALNKPEMPDSIRSTLQVFPDSTFVINTGNKDSIFVYVHLHRSVNAARYIRLGEAKATLSEPVTTIRWIIYTGIFISMGLVVIVSALFARSISKPILQLTGTAREIAEGDVDRKLNLKRKDEFGTLADSLNRMASKLRSDNENLKQIYEQQQQFYADITHEVRNPLHTIMGSLEMLEIEKLPDDRKARYIQNAKNQVDRLNRLFKDLKTLQRYDSDPKFVQPELFDISEAIEHVNEWYRDRDGIRDKKGVMLKITSKPQQAYGDPDKIEQVLDNLISNAVKYSQATVIEVKTRLDGDQLLVEVVDNGIGIPAEHLPRLFDRFYRTDKARSRDKGGTGLGLAVVKSILKRHNSEIMVESEVGKGTRFYFYLPTRVPSVEGNQEDDEET
ncbi:MAG TPA: HAMP domain-containing sensor histidine kinase [Balneolales bacterium]|nr:HAMP domain-containing sensor histidine kinase [Balneolales bacterium]